MSQVSGIDWYPDSFQAIKILQDLGCLIYILTNQSGVGRGYFTMKEVDDIHEQLQQDLKSNNLKPFDGFLVCPHGPQDNCSCRKPKIELILPILKKHQAIGSEIVVIGDKLSDAECGQNAHGLGILVRTKKEKDFQTFKSLLDYAQSLKD